MQNSQHLTRWVAPYPQYTSSIALTPPLMLVTIELKRSKSHMNLLLPSILQTHRHTNLYVSSPRYSTTYYQFSTLRHYPIKATLILSNFGYHPLPNLKYIPGYSCIGYLMHTSLHTGVQNTTLKDKSKGIIWYIMVWGNTFVFTFMYWPT